MSPPENRSSFNQFHKNSSVALEVAELNNEQFSGARGTHDWDLDVLSKKIKSFQWNIWRKYPILDSLFEFCFININHH